MSNAFRPLPDIAIPSRPNPFSPRPGQRPPYVAGRQGQLELVQDRLLTLTQRAVAPPPAFFLGPRGMGKTVLLDEVRHRCRDVGLVVVEVMASLPTSVAEQIASGFRVELDAQRGLLDSLTDRIDSISVAVGIPGARLEVAGRVADSHGTITTIQELGAICRTIREYGRPGAVVIIDELQSARPECLGWLVPAFQEVLQDPLGAPLFFVGAGLEFLPRTLASAGGFAERFDYVQLERVSDVDASLALRLNVESEDVRWMPSAVDAALEAAVRKPLSHPTDRSPCVE